MCTEICPACAGKFTSLDPFCLAGHYWWQLERCLGECTDVVSSTGIFSTMCRTIVASLKFVPPQLMRGSGTSLLFKYCHWLFASCGDFRLCLCHLHSPPRSYAIFQGKANQALIKRHIIQYLHSHLTRLWLSAGLGTNQIKKKTKENQRAGNAAGEGDVAFWLGFTGDHILSESHRTTGRKRPAP